jgi:hypothetical protein
MGKRRLGVWIAALALAGAATGCGGGEQKAPPPSAARPAPEPPDALPAPQAEGLPLPGYYDTATPETLAASVQDAMAGKDFRGLLGLIEPKARRELTRVAKDWFGYAVSMSASRAAAALADRGLTRAQFDAMDDEHFTAHEMWRGARHADLVAQLSGRPEGVRQTGEGEWEASFAVATDAGAQAVTFKLVSTADGWRLVTPGMVPSTMPASRPAGP